MHRFKSERAYLIARVLGLVWALLGGLLLWFAWSDATFWLYWVPLVAILIVQTVVDPRAKRRWLLNINGPEDLDRPGGPYDHLRRKPQKPAQ